ncbi:hypothetical protein Vretimale_8123, partial [Volvox reticuliferus]
HQAKALQQLQQQQQAYQHQLHQQQAAAQQLAAQQAAAASSGHPIADLRAGQLPSGGTDVTAHLAAQMERMAAMMEARFGALESRLTAQVPAEGARGAGYRHPRRAVLARSAVVATVDGDGRRPVVSSVQYGSVRVTAARPRVRLQTAMVAGSSGASAVVDWAFQRPYVGTAPQARFGLDWGQAQAPVLVRSLVVEHLRGLAPNPQVERRLEDIAGVILARVGPKTWKAYASHFAAFVRFCVSEELEFLPAAPYTGVLWAQHLAAKGTVQARTAQPYFSAVNTVHELLGLPKPCTNDNLMFAAFRRGWERLQVSLLTRPSLVLAFSAGDLLSLCDTLSGLPLSAVCFVPVLFVVLGFCTFLRPDSLLSVVWAQVCEVEGLAVFRYKPLNWKGRIVKPESAPVLQFPLCGLPKLRLVLDRHLGHSNQLWPFRQSTSGAEQWFRSALVHGGLGHLVDLHTLYSLRRGGASAARAVGVPLEVIESFGGWSAGSVALRQHYLDMGVLGSPAARASFGSLAAGRVAPFAAQFFNV